MASTQGNEISKTAAVKFFRGARIQVQHARPVKVRGKDGVERPAFEVENLALSESGILRAVDYGDRVAITTIDGQKYETANSGKAEEPK